MSKTKDEMIQELIETLENALPIVKQAEKFCPPPSLFFVSFSQYVASVIAEAKTFVEKEAQIAGPEMLAYLKKIRATALQKDFKPENNEELMMEFAKELKMLIDKATGVKS